MQVDRLLKLTTINAAYLQMIENPEWLAQPDSAWRASIWKRTGLAWRLVQRSCRPSSACHSRHRASNYQQGVQDDGGPPELLTEVRRELTAIRIEAERLAGRVRALETVVERYGADETDAPIGDER